MLCGAHIPDPGARPTALVSQLSPKSAPKPGVVKGFVRDGKAGESPGKLGRKPEIGSALINAVAAKHAISQARGVEMGSRGVLQSLKAATAGAPLEDATKNQAASGWRVGVGFLVTPMLGNGMPGRWLRMPARRMGVSSSAPRPLAPHAGRGLTARTRQAHPAASTTPHTPGFSFSNLVPEINSRFQLPLYSIVALKEPRQSPQVGPGHVPVEGAPSSDQRPPSRVHRRPFRWARWAAWKHQVRGRMPCDLKRLKN